MAISPTRKGLLTGLPTMANKKLLFVGQILDLGYNCPLLVKEWIAPRVGVLINLMGISCPLVADCVVDLSVLLVERWLVDKRTSTHGTRQEAVQGPQSPIGKEHPSHILVRKLDRLAVLIGLVSLTDKTPCY
jgi:hypothetical protein